MGSVVIAKVMLFFYAVSRIIFDITFMYAVETDPSFFVLILICIVDAIGVGQYFVICRNVGRDRAWRASSGGVALVKV